MVLLHKSISIIYDVAFKRGRLDDGDELEIVGWYLGCYYRTEIEIITREKKQLSARLHTLLCTKMYILLIKQLFVGSSTGFCFA